MGLRASARCSTLREHPDPKQPGCEELLHRLDGAHIARWDRDARFSARAASLGSIREPSSTADWKGLLRGRGVSCRAQGR